MKNSAFMPKRMGITMRPVLKSFILVSPESRIVRPPLDAFDTSMVIKSDMLQDKIEQHMGSVSLESFFAFGRLIGQDTLRNIGGSLALRHQPAGLTIGKNSYFGLRPHWTRGPVLGELQSQRHARHSLRRTRRPVGTSAPHVKKAYRKRSRYFAFNAKDVSAGRPIVSAVRRPSLLRNVRCRLCRVLPPVICLLPHPALRAIPHYFPRGSRLLIS